MRSLPFSLATIVLLAVWATAQDKPADTKPEAEVPDLPPPEDVAAREAGIRTAWINALNLAHQIAASQSYHRRNTFWSAPLPSEGFTIVPLQFYAGNDYYVILGTDAEADADTIAAAAFGPDRRLIKSAPDRAGGKLVLKITPKKSGPHYIRLHQQKGTKKTAHCALTYVYK